MLVAVFPRRSGSPFAVYPEQFMTNLTLQTGDMLTYTGLCLWTSIAAPVKFRVSAAAMNALKSFELTGLS